MKIAAFLPPSQLKTEQSADSQSESVNYHLKYAPKKAKSKIYGLITDRAANRQSGVYGLQQAAIAFFPALAAKSPVCFPAAAR